MGLEWLGGVALSIAGNVLNNLGTNYMKLGHNNRLQLAVPHAAYKEGAWQAGLVLLGLGNLAMFYAFGYAAQSILAALGCIQFVCNIAFAALVLKEKITNQVVCATALIVVGCVLLVVFGSHVGESFNVQQLMEFYKNPAYICYLVVGSVAVFVSFLLYWIGDRAIGAKQLRPVKCWTSMMPVLFSVFSALVCTQSLIFNKAVMVLWRMTLAGDNQFTKWQTWLMAVAFIVTSLLWVFQINKGLQAFPALIIVPCLQLCWTLFGVISGLLYFKEYVGMTGLQVGMFVLGVGVVCLGAGLLSSTPPGDSTALAHHEHAEEDGAPLQTLASQRVDLSAGPFNGPSPFQLMVWSGRGDGSSTVAQANGECSSSSSFGSLNGTLSALQPAGHSVPLEVSYVPPAPVVQTGLLLPQGSLDSASLAHMTRRGNHPMSRLRTVSMPR